jgi:hypothetical protein
VWTTFCFLVGGVDDWEMEFKVLEGNEMRRLMYDTEGWTWD